MEGESNLQGDLIDVLNALGIHDDDCYEMGETPCGKCEACKANDARAKLKRLISPKCLPVPRYLERLEYNDGDNREKRILDLWDKENHPEPWLNRGIGTLDHLLHDGLKHSTYREVEIAATVIQWLGTNCGFAFISDFVNKELNRKG